jgi:hypothetical protein
VNRVQIRRHKNGTSEEVFLVIAGKKWRKIKMETTKNYFLSDMSVMLDVLFNEEFFA